MNEVMDKIINRTNSQKDIKIVINSPVSKWTTWLTNHRWEMYNLFTNISFLNLLPIDFFKEFINHLFVLTIDDLLDAYYGDLYSEYMKLFLIAYLLMDDFEECPIKYTEPQLKKFFVEFVRPNIEEIYISNKCLKHFYNLFSWHFNENDKVKLAELIGNYPLEMDDETLWTVEKVLPYKMLRKSLFQAKLLEV